MANPQHRPEPAPALGEPDRSCKKHCPPPTSVVGGGPRPWERRRSPPAAPRAPGGRRAGGQAGTVRTDECPDGRTAGRTALRCALPLRSRLCLDENSAGAAPPPRGLPPPQTCRDFFALGARKSGDQIWGSLGFFFPKPGIRSWPRALNLPQGRLQQLGGGKDKSR